MMSFVDEGTRAKFSMVKNADDLAAICGGKKTKMLMSCCSSPKVMNR